MKKIKNIPLNVCSCEQKIAYNLAFREHININDYLIKTLQEIEQEQNKIINSLGYVAALSDTNYNELGQHKIDISNGITADILKGFQFSPDYENIKKKYNLLEIKTALQHGIISYLLTPFIASDYAAIGECFWL